jgi:hypothetical protein
MEGRKRAPSHGCLGRQPVAQQSAGAFKDAPVDTLAVLVQLPVPDQDPAAARASVPLAAGCLKSFAEAAGAAPPGSLRMLPPAAARRGGDAAVLSWILSSGAPLVGFTCSLWNIQRNLWLARQLKARAPGTRIILGGPEIVEGRSFPAEAVDCRVVGEGEQAFTDALRDWTGAGRLGREYRGGAGADLNEFPSPYLSGVMGSDAVEAGDPLYLETTRGCAHRCTYCYYAKSFPGVRRFPPSRLEDVFTWARERSVPEIYIMDPSFTSAAGWEKAVAAMARLNTSGIPLHTELRLEAITPERAALLADAGFRSVEAGLQSTNPAALRAVRRSWQRDAFSRGARLLTGRGITVKTGVILGLPEDTPESFDATIRFVQECGLAPDLEVYPLSVLPGTRLREEAGARGLRHMAVPPYWVLSTPTISEASMMDCIRRLEERLGTEFFPPIPPRFRDPAPGLIGFADLRSPEGWDLLQGDPDRLGSDITILIGADGLRGLPRLKELGRSLLACTPHTMFRLVVESAAPPDRDAMEQLAEAFYHPAHYFNQIHYFSRDLQGRFSVRLYRLVSSFDEAAAAADDPWDLVVRWSPGLASVLGQGMPRLPFLLLDRPPQGQAEQEIQRLYRGNEELIIRTGRS